MDIFELSKHLGFRKYERLIELINIRNKFTALMKNNDVAHEAYKQIRDSADLLLRVDLGIIKIY